MWKSLLLLNSRVRMLIYIVRFLIVFGNSRSRLNIGRGTIVDSKVRGEQFTAAAEVALNDMFGYSNFVGLLKGRVKSAWRIRFTLFFSVGVL